MMNVCRGKVCLFHTLVQFKLTHGLNLWVKFNPCSSCCTYLTFVPNTLTCLSHSFSVNATIVSVAVLPPSKNIFTTLMKENEAQIVKYVSFHLDILTNADFNDNLYN